MNTKCDYCHINNVTRICSDCISPTKAFCEKCFIKNHSGKSTKHHTTIDPIHKAIILNRRPNSQSPDQDLISLHHILSNQNSQSEMNITHDETLEKAIKVKIDSISIPKDLCYVDRDNFLPDIDKYLEYDSTSIILPQESLIIEKQGVLYESGAVVKIESIEKLAALLKIQKSIDKFEVPIITFISKPTNKGNSANYLLLGNNSTKFPTESDRSESSLCFMVYDTEHKCLVLDTTNMYKTNHKYLDSQIKLMNLILALSDIIVFSENSVKTDFIRIHEMMTTFQKRFYHFLYKICKANPKSLAPGLIYLKLSNFKFADTLEKSIENTVDRRDLFASFTEIVNFNKKNFWNALENMLSNLSDYRNRHSFADILLCINNCQESQGDILSNDIPLSWFICNLFCELCDVQCRRPYGHSTNHDNEVCCIQSTSNAVYFCKKCMNEDSNNRPNLPLQLKPISKDESFLKNILAYPFRRGIVECEKHKIIHDHNWICQSYEDSVFIKYLHKWPGHNLPYEDAYPVSQMVIDTFRKFSEPMSKIATQSAECISDLIKPEDWQSTSVASHCGCCNGEFTSKMWKHHCRSCKKVICSTCSDESKSSIICKTCSDSGLLSNSIEEPRGIIALNLFRDTINISSNFFRRNVTAFTRPQYWENDDLVIRCFICEKEFHSEKNPIHHCRTCGKCVCDMCSPERRPVEWRCIYDPNRICNKCIENHSWKRTC